MTTLINNFKSFKRALLVQVRRQKISQVYIVHRKNVHGYIIDVNTIQSVILYIEKKLVQLNLTMKRYAVRSCRTHNLGSNVNIQLLIIDVQVLNHELNFFFKRVVHVLCIFMQYSWFFFFMDNLNYLLYSYSFQNSQILW